MAVDPEAREDAARALRGLNDLYGRLGGMAADISGTRREVRASKRMTAIMIPLAVAAIGGITQVQVAAIGARSQQSAEIGGEQAAQKKMDQLLAELQRERDALRVERERLERQRTDPDVVTIARGNSPR